MNNRRRQTMTDLEGSIIRKRHTSLLTDEQYQSTKATVHAMQMKIFNFLERPSGWKCFVYHSIVFCLVLLCLILSVLDDDEESLDYILYPMEVAMTCFFAIEYAVRCWAAGYHGKYAGWRGRLRFMRKPIAVIDLTVITASVIWLQFGGEGQGQVFATSAFRGIRFLQILRMLHVDRQGGSWKLLMSVVYIHRTELITSMYIGFLCLIFASYFVYLSEKEMLLHEAANSTGPLGTDIVSFGDSLWWGIITVATIGYGDKVPRTWIGRTIASVYCIVATAFFALPSGILGSGFALKVQHSQRQKHFNRQIPPAATLIQTLWRLYEMEASFRSRSDSATARYFAHRCFSRRPSYKVSLSTADSPIKTVKPAKAMFISSPLINIIKTTQTLYATMATDESIENSQENSEVLEDQTSLKVPALPAGLVARRSSLSSLQASQNPSANASPLHFPAQQTTQDDIRIKYEHSPPKSPGSKSGGENGGDEILFRKRRDKLEVLNDNQRTMILIVLRMKVFVAKRKFQQSRKPYDVRDVIEQYSQGNTNVVGRLKNLQRRVDSLHDQMERRANDTDMLQTVYQRVSVVEEQVGDLSRKINKLLELLEK